MKMRIHSHGSGNVASANNQRLTHEAVRWLCVGLPFMTLRLRNGS